MQDGCKKNFTDDEITISKDNDVVVKANNYEETTKRFCLQANSENQLVEFDSITFTQTKPTQKYLDFIEWVNMTLREKGDKSIGNETESPNRSSTLSEDP
jgi:hypothetical protein